MNVVQQEISSSAYDGVRCPDEPLGHECTVAHIVWHEFPKHIACRGNFPIWITTKETV